MILKSLLKFFVVLVTSAANIVWIFLIWPCLWFHDLCVRTYTTIVTSEVYLQLHFISIVFKTGFIVLFRDFFYLFFRPEKADMDVLSVPEFIQEIRLILNEPHDIWEEMDDYFDDVADAYFVDTSDPYDPRADIKGMIYGVKLWYRETRDYARREYGYSYKRAREVFSETMLSWKWFIMERDYAGFLREFKLPFAYVRTLFRNHFTYLVKNVLFWWPMFLGKLFLYKYAYTTTVRRGEEMVLLREYFPTGNIKIMQFKRIYLYWTLFMRLRIAAAQGDGGVHVNYLWEYYLPKFELLSQHPEDVWRLTFRDILCSPVQSVDAELYSGSRFSKVEYTQEDRIKMKDQRLS
jgi:hypothetical protein